MKKFTLVIVAVLVVALGGSIGFRVSSCNATPVTVVHWANSHLMRPGLMIEMADQFNQEGHWTAWGRRIQVKVYNHGSAEQSDDLASRVNQKGPLERDFPDPVIVTPSSADWLIRANETVGHTVVDTANARSIVKAYIGIVTYRDMAESLGWPDKPIGYADIIALRDNPQGWAAYPGAKAEWGQRPLVAFTDPVTSTTGRSVLFSLYAIAAGKDPENLSLDDINNPAVVSYIEKFQTLIDHYMIGTIPLNTKVYQGPRYGHFFLMPEDNLIHLYGGTEDCFINGVEVLPPPIDKDKPMMMVYPKEGSMVRNNIAGMVEAPWVTPEQREGAEQWIDFLLQDNQQRKFMQAGFRPGSNLSLSDPASKINSRYGLKAEPNTKLLYPERVNPNVAATIEENWPEVKRPGIVTFVMDASISMSGTKLNQARQGIAKALNNMAQGNQVGFLSISDTVSNQVPVAPLSKNRFNIDNAIQNIKLQNPTALYDGIKTGIDMTDRAEGASDAIRALVVLTDGHASGGKTKLDDIIHMTSSNEVPIARFGGMDGELWGLNVNGNQVPKKDIIGSELAIATQHQIQIFFIGIGDDADLDVGRILSQATGAEFQGIAEKDLAQLLEQFSKYF